MTTDKLGFDRPGALTRYFAKRWLKRRGTKDEQQLIAWLLETALGRNALYFIEKTKEYVDAWKGSGEIVPVDAFNGFAITGDPIEDLLIPHAVLVWTCMNDRPWPEGIYHRWLDELLAAGSAEAAYLAASLWPAHDLMAKVRYRPAGWLVYRGQLDAEAERLILTEMLMGEYGPRTSLYGSFEYDNVLFPIALPIQYIQRHGFTHPICGLVKPLQLEWNRDLWNRIQEALVAPSWSEGVKGAAMLLYLSLKRCAGNSKNIKEFFNILEQNLFKLDNRHINIINFHTDKIEKIDYDLIKGYINYLIILYNQTNNEDLLIKMLSKYISIGLKTKDIFYIGKEFKNIIVNLMPKEREKLESWLKKQADDPRIKDLLLAKYLSRRIYHNYMVVNELLQTYQVEEKIESIYGKIKYFDKISLLISQARIYFSIYNLSQICDFINDILKREKKVYFTYKFKEDYEKIIYSCHLNKKSVFERQMFLKSSHIGLYLYYGILNKWEKIIFHFNKNKKNKIKLYLRTRDEIIKNLHIYAKNNIEIKLNLYLNKIGGNNLPCEEIKYELIVELIDIIKNNYAKISEYFKDENKIKLARKVILSNIELIKDELRDLRLIELLGIDNKSKSMIMY
jgi:hypothetical protein